MRLRLGVNCYKSGCAYSHGKFEPIKNYYHVLNLQANCTKAAIRNSYLNLAKKYHPDMNPNGKQKFTLIQEAYQVLSDENSKKQYDSFYAEHFTTRNKGKSTHHSEYKASSSSGYDPYRRNSSQFKGQRMNTDSQNTRNSSPEYDDLKAKREQWTKQFYELFGQEKKQKPKKTQKKRDPIDEEYRHVQYTFSNKNPFSPRIQKQQSRYCFGDGESYWEKLKSLLKK